MTELTLEQIQAQIARIEASVARVIRVLNERPPKAFAAVTEPVAVPAAEVARMLSVKRSVVYDLHRTGDLNGFRVHPRAHLKFLVSEVRELAAKMAEERRDA